MQYNARKMKHNKRKKITRSGEAETVNFCFFFNAFNTENVC